MIQLEIFRRIMLKGSGVQPRVIAPTIVPSVYTHKYTHANTFDFFKFPKLLELRLECKPFKNANFKKLSRIHLKTLPT